MNTRVLCALSALVMVLGIATAVGAYTGSLSVGNGLVGTGDWAVTDEPAALSWEVTQMTGYWHYSYTLVVPGKSVSHVIMTASETFTTDNMWNLQVSEGAIGDHVVDTFLAPPPSDPDALPNPYMPADIHGIKFDDTEGLTLIFSFDSDRAPMWGDFYAKDGKSAGVMNALYSAGFAAPNPTAPVSDDSVDYHILVPDTISEVPEPGSLAMMAVGALGLLIRRRSTK